MNYTLHIIRKSVKHLRIKVLDEWHIQAIAPKLMSEDRIKNFVKSKHSWIQKQQKKISHAREFFHLEDGQILLHGEKYSIAHRTGQGKHYTVDHKHKIVWRWYDLSDKNLQTTWYKTYAKNTLPDRLQQLSKQHGISYDKCFIRDQKTKRGTCSTLGHIWLNRRLIKMPSRVMDYVIVHELAHRKIMNHSQNFRDYLTELYPKTPEARKWLKVYGRWLQ